MRYNKLLKICIFAINALSLLAPVGAFLLLPMALMLAVAGGKSRAVLRAFREDRTVVILSGSYAVSIFFSRLLPLSLLIAALIALQLAYLSLVRTVLDYKDLNTWNRIINLAAVAVCIIAMFQFLSGHANTYSSWIDHKSFGDIKRVYATLYNPNIFAGFLAINLSWSVAKQSSGQKDRFTSANIILSSLCLILTYSRGGFLAFCAAMLVIFVLTGRKKLLVYTAVMAAAFYTANYTGAANRADYASVIADSSNTYRLEIWRAGIRMFLERPLTGSGIGTAWVFLSTYSDKLFRYVLHAHNIFIQAAAETGILGVAALAYFFAANLAAAIKSWRRTKKEEVSFVFLGFTASLASILVHGMIDAVIMLPSLSLIFIGYYAMYRIISESSSVVTENRYSGISLYEEDIA